MKPFLISSAYGNYASDEGDAIAREAYGLNYDRLAALREAYGLNYDRLAALKNKYDPTNFFRMNHNIKPTEMDRGKTAHLGAVQAETL
jgi:FAD/FMN-containing dehydrogenase